MKNRNQVNYLLKFKELVLDIWEEGKKLTSPSFKETFGKTISIIFIGVVSTGFFIIIGEFIVLLLKLII